MQEKKQKKNRLGRKRHRTRQGGREGGMKKGRTWEEIEEKPVWETETGGESWLSDDSHKTELLNKQHKYANNSNMKLCVC